MSWIEKKNEENRRREEEDYDRRRWKANWPSPSLLPIVDTMRDHDRGIRDGVHDRG